MNKTVYILVLLLAAFAAMAYAQRLNGIFACPADEYTTTNYLAYCNAGDYGDYDRGAFWFSLKPEAVQAVIDADILFLGNSRLQFGLSSHTTADWFSRAGIRHYLLGFSHTENISFLSPLLERLRPRARAYVINVDHIFRTDLRAPTARLLTETDARARYQSKRQSQTLHRFLCQFVPPLCGGAIAFYREPSIGHWTVTGHTDLTGSGIADTPSGRQPDWDAQLDTAERFITGLDIAPKCVLLTVVPSATTRRDEAEWLAEQLQLPLISPRLSGLRTFDGSHLDAISSEAWSRAFLQAAGQSIKDCVEGPESPVRLTGTT